MLKRIKIEIGKWNLLLLESLMSRYKRLGAKDGRLVPPRNGSHTSEAKVKADGFPKKTKTIRKLLAKAGANL